MHMTATTTLAIRYVLNGDFESIKTMNSQSFIEKDNPRFPTYFSQDCFEPASIEKIFFVF